MQPGMRLLLSRRALGTTTALRRYFLKAELPFRISVNQLAAPSPLNFPFCHNFGTDSALKGDLYPASPGSSLQDSDFGAVDPVALRGSRYSGRPWSASEDLRLQEAVSRHGRDWTKAATCVGNGRTNRGCRQRWLLSLQESVNKRPFTSTEKALILRLLQRHPKQWTKVAERLDSGHSPTQVRDFAVRRGGNRDNYRVWTVEEDGFLRAAVDKHGVGKWAAVAEIVPGRSDASCYSRWTFSLDPALVRGAWSEEEDIRLHAAVDALKKSGELFHFGDVAVLMRNRRHRKACRSRYKRLMAIEEAESEGTKDAVKVPER